MSALANPLTARLRLPVERRAVTHSVKIGGHRVYIIVGLFEDGRPGELFLRMAKPGSMESGLLDSLAIAVSIALQYRVPLKTFIEKFSHARFEPAGFTGNPDIPIAKSIVDYVFRWLEIRFPGVSQ